MVVASLVDYVQFVSFSSQEYYVSNSCNVFISTDSVIVFFHETGNNYIDFTRHMNHNKNVKLLVFSRSLFHCNLLNCLWIGGCFVFFYCKIFGCYQNGIALFLFYVYLCFCNILNCNFIGAVVFIIIFYNSKSFGCNTPCLPLFL